jgi:toxin FitB
VSALLLDTNIPSESIRSRPDPKVDAWIHEQDDETLHVSVVTIGELRKGLNLAPQGKRRSELEEWLEKDLIPTFDGRMLPVTKAIAERWGALSAQRQLAGRPLSMADGLIAATALEHGLTLVTRNVKDFEQLGVTILNPWD